MLVLAVPGNEGCQAKTEDDEDQSDGEEGQAEHQHLQLLQQYRLLGKEETPITGG